MPLMIPARGGPGTVQRVGYKPGGVGGKGKALTGLTGAKRHRRIQRDTIHGIYERSVIVAKPDIRRLARRGGVKRISATIYDEIRLALQARLRQILHDCVVFTEYRNAKTVTVNDVIFSLKRIGRPIYGFDPDTTNVNPRKHK